MNTLNKVCIFCGNKPKSKSNEHVIPKWLMDHVGITDDIVRLGFDKRTGNAREYAYKAFTFPACQECNTKFGDLETAAKPIIIRVLSKEPLAKGDLHCLLDWFDKVRIGLWLGFYYLDKNIGGISPKFHIQDRIAAQDRMLHIVHVTSNRKELSFRGCDTLSFQFTPSCFSMIINNFCFYNLSSPFLFAMRFGFPFPSVSYLREDGLVDYRIKSGRLRITRPLLLKQFAFKGTGIYQPIYRSVITTPFFPYYDNEYVRSRSISFNRGLGDIFLHNGQNIMSYPSEPSMLWIPLASYERQSMNPGISIDTIEQQLNIEAQLPSPEKLPMSHQKEWENTLKNTRRFSRKLISILKKNAQKGVPNK